MPDDHAFNLLGICGSLRHQSFNASALRAVGTVLPSGTQLEIADIAGIPLYNGDVQAEGIPDSVLKIARQIAISDAVIIATPEYNYSIPGVLKNAIDWISRVPDQPFAGKPVAILGASPGRLGTARAQYHLRQVFVFLDARVLNKPEIMIGGASQLIGEDGKLTDETTLGFLRDLVEALVRRIEEHRRNASQATTA